MSQESLSPPVTNRKSRSRTPIALGFAFLVGALLFFLVMQLAGRFRPGSLAQGLIPIKDRAQTSAALAIPLLNDASTGPGATWNLADQHGKVVLLNLFATWCGPCREEMPILLSLAKEYSAKGLVLVALSVDHDNDAPGQTRLAVLRNFAREQTLPFPILLPSEQSPLMTTSLPVPQTILFDKQGRRAQLITGKIDQASVEQSIDELLNEN